MSFPPNPSYGGGGGSFVINDDHFFADNDARDTYFTAHPDELETGTLIKVGTEYQQYNGTSWTNVTAVVTGPAGVDGADGEDGIVTLGETSDTAYRGDRGKAAYDHSQVIHAPSNAEQNVQSDWNQTDIESDDYIKNKPTIPAAQVQTDWNATEGMGVILNKPTIPGEYSLPTASDTILGGIKVGSRLTIADGVLSAEIPEDIIGVEWDRESTTPVLRRIDRNGNDITLTTTDFDYHPIYGNMKRVQLNSSGQVVATGNGRGDGLTLTNDYIMVRIPKVYYRHIRVDALGNEDAAGRYERILISPYPVGGFVLHNAFYARGHLITPPDYIHVGAYTGIISSSKLLSKSGVTSTVSQKMQTFETAATTNGSGFGIMDIHTLSLLKTLFIVEYASWNSQAVLGNGNVGSSAQLATGSTNVNLASNGTWGTTANQTSGMCWRGIENFWGNILQFIIGFNGYTDKYRIISPDGSGVYTATLAEGSYIEHTSPTPIWYSNAQGGTLSGKSTNGTSYGYIKDFLFTEQTKGLFIPSLLGGSDSTYIPDLLYSVNPITQPTIWVHGGYWANALNAGAFNVSLDAPVALVNSNLGARVCFI